MRIVRALFRAAQSATKEHTSYERFIFKADGYCKYGLVSDDLLSEHNDDVVEALRRLPEDMIWQRIFRQNRAAQLSMTHSILPADQWTKIEEDKPYLSHLVDDVVAEKLEKKNWEDNNPL